MTDEKKELDLDNLPEEWRYAPWVDQACKIVGKLSGELGRALDTSQKAIAKLQECLKAEDELLEEDPELIRQFKRHFEDGWFLQKKAARLEEAQPKKRKRNRR